METGINIQGSEKHAEAVADGIVKILSQVGIMTNPPTGSDLVEIIGKYTSSVATNAMVTNCTFSSNPESRK